MKKILIFKRNSRLCYTLILQLLLLPAYAFQQQYVTGLVTDASGALPGVSVTIKDTQSTTITDKNGYYVLEAEPGQVLVFTYLGYQTQEIAITENTINIFMEPDATMLAEVEINAGYYTVKDRERTGSIARVTAKDMESQQAMTNVLGAMQGRVAGVSITQDSGSPGGAFQIKIRGQNSLRADGNQPLYIIDGVPYSSETIGSINTSGIQPTLTTPLNSINPSDIESIEILKDADATAIYGSRGANGVVLITTKKGKAGKTQINLIASNSWGHVTRNPKLLSTEQYISMREQAFANDGVTEYPGYAYDVNGTWDKNRYTDWQKELIGGTAEIHNLQASVTGGSEQTQYLLSGNTRKETTVFPGDFNYKKAAVHYSMNHKSSDERFEMVFSGNYVVQDNNQPATDLTRVSRLLAPNAPALYDEEGKLNWENSTWENPLASLESEFVSKIKDLTVNSVLSYRLMDNLRLKTSLGYSDLRNNESRTLPSTRYDPAYGVGSEISSLLNNITTRNSWIVEPQLNWNYSTGVNKIEALVGTTFQNQVTDRLFQTGVGFTSNSLIYDLASASTNTIDLSDEAIYRYQAWFARLNYNYDERYILNLTGRRDGSSRFGPGKQFANFGALGLAWLFSNENFLKENKIISFGKLRSSYGITGNDQIGDYQFLDTYLSSGNSYQGVIGLNPVRLYNPEFGWEKNRKFEMALETGFINDRIFLTTAYYNNRSSNQLVGIPLPGTTGFSVINSNLNAEVENSGWELTLSLNNFDNKDFSWKTDFNISFNKNKLLSYPGLETSSYGNTYVIGQPLNIIKLYHYTGTNENGVYQFEDMDNDGIITSLGDRQKVADLNPKFFGGIQNQFSYKNFRLDFLFQFVSQKSFGLMTGVPGLPVNQTQQMYSQAQPFTAGMNSEVMTAYNRFGQSDEAIVDASYIRLKNISLTYDMQLASEKLKCQLFLQGQNLLTFTPFEGDPEFKFMGYLPPLKVVTVGFKLTY